MMRLRITFAKRGPVKYSSHLDLMRVWERSLRRAGVPLAYSGGYNPRPKLQLADALPLGHSSEGELLDVWLEEPIGEQGDKGALSSFVRELSPVLPEGLAVKEVRSVDLKAPAMQTQVVAARYRVTVESDGPPGALAARIGEAMEADELPHERRGKRYNLRPLIEELRLESATEERIVLEMQLAARPGATGRPEAVLDVLGLGDAFARYHRQRLLLEAG